MTVVHAGSTKKYAEGWNAIFGQNSPTPSVTEVATVDSETPVVKEKKKKDGGKKDSEKKDGGKKAEAKKGDGEKKDSKKKSGKKKK